MRRGRRYMLRGVLPPAPAYPAIIRHRAKPIGLPEIADTSSSEPRQALLQLRARPVDARLHGVGRNPGHLRNILVGQALDLTQQNDLPECLVEFAER